MVIESPFEIFELVDGETRELIIKEWEEGRAVIHPKPELKPKEVKILRVHVPPEIKPLFPYYWDITSTTLIAQLKPYLEKPDFAKYKYIITKYGVAPKARFSLKVEPL